MKQAVSPVVVAVIAIVVLAAVGYFGYRAVAGGPATGGSRPPAAQDTQKMREQYQNYGEMRGRGTGGQQGQTGYPTGR